MNRTTKLTAFCNKRASLSAEIANFKAIVRHIIHNNADRVHQCLFLMDQRAHIRRLNTFAIIGHQPGFNASRATTELERRKVELAIMRQRVGTTPKQALATMRSVHARRDEGDICTFKLKRVKLDTKSVPRWTREFRSTPIMPLNLSKSYTSRLLSCRSCGHVKETAHMQLKIKDGYRGICCPGCHRQARVTSNLCQCKLIWHQCPTHKHDPVVHRSQKPVQGDTIRRTKLDRDKLSLYRTAPEAQIKRPTKRRKTVKMDELRLHQHGLQSSASTVAPVLSAVLQPRLAAKFPHLTARGNK
jgi:hypothetical protein